MLSYSNENMVSAAAETGTQRSVYWDVVKSVAIFTVVLGHCGGPSVPLAYIINYFHMASFFFIAGALYKDKHSGDPLTYIGKRLRSIYFLAVKYIIAYILLHNLFIKMNIYSTVTTEAMIYPKSYYGKADILSACFRAICGGTWGGRDGRSIVVLPASDRITVTVLLASVCRSLDQTHSISW